MHKPETFESFEWIRCLDKLVSLFLVSCTLHANGLMEESHGVQSHIGGSKN